MKITNISDGPRGFNAQGGFGEPNGPTILEPGQSIEATLSEVELGKAKETGWFRIEESKPKAKQ